MTAKRFLLTTFFVNLVFVVLAAAVCLYMSGLPMCAGVVLGGGLGAVNLYILGVIILRLLSSGTGKLGLALLLVLKMTVLLAAAFILIKYAAVDVVSFAAGLTTTVLAIIVNSARVALQGLEISI